MTSRRRCARWPVRLPPSTTTGHTPTSGTGLRARHGVVCGVTFWPAATTATPTRAGCPITIQRRIGRVLASSGRSEVLVTADLNADVVAARQRRDEWKRLAEAATEGPWGAADEHGAMEG